MILVSIGEPESDKLAAYLAALAALRVPEEQVRVLRATAGVDYADLAAKSTGLLLAGGEDVEPARYGEAALPAADVSCLPPRDEMEFALLAGAREARVPVWGICRGLQVLNVFHGGSLWQDLALQRPGAVPHNVHPPEDALVHTITARPAAGRLAERLAVEEPLVNSRHHQGIKALGNQLTAVGHAPDGLVEAIEGTTPGWWVRAVQWHPENLVNLELQRTLWQDFLTETRR